MHSGKISIICFALLVSVFAAFCQPTNQDCLNAIPICQSIFSTSLSYSGEGNDSNEINPTISCLLMGEKNDVWYTFTVSTSGNLNFTISPNNPNDDYDWAVFNLTNSICTDILANPSLAVGCNYSPNIGCGGATGPNGNTTGPCGAQNGPVIPVVAGQTYVINISNFSSTQSGYTIDFTSSTASIFDNVPPQLNTISTLSCGTDTIDLFFSENILCASVQATDFTLSGPGGPFIVTAATSPQCIVGSQYGRNFHLTFSPAISLSGTYTFSIAGSIQDLCGNQIAIPTNRTLAVSGITLNPSHTDATCPSGNDGTASVTVTSGTGPFTYQWTPNVSVTGTASNLTAGTYVVTVSAAGSCPAQSTIIVNQPTAFNITHITTPATCGSSNGTAQLIVIGGTSPYSYQWSPSGGTNSSASNLAAGTYTITITDNVGCTVNHTLGINTLSTLMTSIGTVQNVTCYGYSNGSIHINVSGGSGNYTFQWSPNVSTTSTATNLSPGLYSVSVIDGACLVVFSNISITQPSTALTATITTTQTTCGNNDGTATMNPSGGVTPYTYQWSPSGGTNQIANNLAAGNYTCTVTDNAGCSFTQTATVSPSNGASVTVNYIKQTVSCYGGNNGSVSLVVAGGAQPYTYQWSGGLPATQNQNNLSAGTYTATVTDNTGCAIQTTITIYNPPQLNIQQNGVSNVLCYGQNTGSASVSAFGGTGLLALQWFPTGGTGANSINLSAGIYTVTVTDANSCTANVTITITQPASALQAVLQPHSTSCGNNNGSVSVTPGGGTSPYTYLWSNAAITNAISNLPSGNYTVTVTDANGCTKIQSANIASSSPVVIANTISTNVLCHGDSTGYIHIVVTGGVTPYNYIWSNGNTSGGTLSNLPAGNYIYTVSDVAGCSVSNTVLLTQPTAIALATSPNQSICNNQQTILTALASGGISPYQYVWSTGTANDSITVSPSVNTNYTVTVTDANNCIKQSNAITVSLYPLLSVTPIPDTSICENKTINLHATAHGGNGVYQYNWGNGLTNSSTFTISTSVDTTITVTIYDGCGINSVIENINIYIVPQPVVDFDFNIDKGCKPLAVNFTNHSASITNSTFQWNFGDGSFATDSNPAHIFSVAGNYTVELTVTTPAPQLCAAKYSNPNRINVMEIPVAEFVYTPENPTLFSPLVTFKNISSFANSYQWSFGDGGFATSVNAEHTYTQITTYNVTLIAKNDSLCSDTVTHTVTVGNEYALYIPSGFTPNGDGINDVFQIYGTNIIEFSISIYNRWGQLVLSSSALPFTWDGTDITSHTKLPFGTYSYIIKSKDNFSTYHINKGNISIVR
jgi:gliding motility-associated-like protein